jgi:hypothetical protein
MLTLEVTGNNHSVLPRKIFTNIRLMKSTLIISFLLLLVVLALGQNAMTFEDFKKLSASERDKLIQSSPPALQGDLYLWMARLSMGEDEWQKHERRRLVLAKGLGGLEEAFDVQVNVLSKFLQQKEGAAKKSGMSAKELDTLSSADYAKVLACTFQRDDEVILIAKLAPTPEAMALSKKADKLASGWGDLENDDNVIIKQADIDAMEKAVAEIRNEMKKLPQWTQQQLDAATAALPKEQHIHAP